MQLDVIGVLAMGLELMLQQILYGKDFSSLLNRLIDSSVVSKLIEAGWFYIV